MSAMLENINAIPLGRSVFEFGGKPQLSVCTRTGCGTHSAGRLLSSVGASEATGGSEGLQLVTTQEQAREEGEGPPLPEGL